MHQTGGRTKVVPQHGKFQSPHGGIGRSDLKKSFDNFEGELFQSPYGGIGASDLATSQ